MNRMTKLAWSLLLLSLAGVAGCYPREMIVWSPDGQQALVMTSDKAYLCNGEGKLASLDVAKVKAAGWLPDSKSIVLAFEKSAEKWAEIAAVLTQQDRDTAMKAGKAFEEIIVSKSGAPTDDDLSAAVKTAFGERGDLVAPALLYLREQNPEPLRQKLGAKADVLDKMVASYTVLQQFQAAGVALQAGPVVFNSLTSIVDLRISPDGKNILYVTPPGEQDARLYVVPLAAGAAPKVVAEAAALSPDWSADGRAALFIAPVGPRPGSDSQLRLGTVVSQELCDAGGALLATFPGRQDLAGTLFADTLRVRAMKDGRIVFAAVDARLPAVAGDMPSQPSLFVLNPGRSATVDRLLPADADRKLAGRTDLFEISPDQTQISVPGEKGEVSVVDIARGTVTAVQAFEGKELLSVPTWRSPDELCVVLPAGTPAGSAARPEVALYKAGTAKVISRDWPGSVVEAIRYTEPQSQPATQPAAP